MNDSQFNELSPRHAGSVSRVIYMMYEVVVVLSAAFNVTSGRISETFTVRKLGLFKIHRYMKDTSGSFSDQETLKAERRCEKISLAGSWQRKS